MKVVGPLAWLWLYRILLAPNFGLATVIAAAMILANSNGSVRYYHGGDLMLWAFAPIVLLLATAAAAKSAGCDPARQLTAGAFAGLLACCLYGCKFSGVFLVLGLPAGASLLWFRKEVSALFVVGLVGAIAPGGLVVDRIVHVSGGSPASTLFSHFEPEKSLINLVQWFSAGTDFHHAVEGVAKHIAARYSSGSFVQCISGLAGLIATLVMVAGWRRHRDSATARTDNPNNISSVLAMSMALTEICGVSFMIAAGANVAVDPRLTRVSGCLLLPILAQLCLQNALPFIQTPKTISLAVMHSVLLAMIMGSAGYGAAVLYRDAVAQRAEWVRRADSKGLVNQHITAAVDGIQFERSLRDKIPHGSVVYSVYPQMLFALADHRVMVREAVEQFDGAALKNMSFYPRGAAIVLLLPETPSFSRKSQIIRNKFHGVTFHSQPTSDPDWTLWISSPEQSPPLSD